MNQNALAIDIGGSKLLMGLVAPSGEIICQVKQSVDPEINEQGVLAMVDTMFQELLQQQGELDFSAVGVTIPGLADAENGIWILAPFSGICQFDIRSELSRLFNVPVFIENDVNACAIAEHAYGCCQDTSDFVWITVSNGCGGSVFADGDLYRGAFSNAGEVGHIVVEEDNALPCGCGNMGCFEAMAAGPGIVKRYCRDKGLGHPHGMTAETIAQLAADGDPVAWSVYARTGYYIGKVLAIMANTLNPAKIVLGGGVSLSRDLFEDEMLATYQRMVFRTASPDLQIVNTALGTNAALLGAAAIAAR